MGGWSNTAGPEGGPGAVFKASTESIDVLPDRSSSLTAEVCRLRIFFSKSCSWFSREDPTFSSVSAPVIPAAAALSETPCSCLPCSDVAGAAFSLREAFSGTPSSEPEFFAAACAPFPSGGIVDLPCSSSRPPSGAYCTKR